jgi:hypothetical protein
MRRAIALWVLLVAGCKVADSPVSPEIIKACKEVCAPQFVKSIDWSTCVCQAPCERGDR